MGWFDFLWDDDEKSDIKIKHPKLGVLAFQDEGWWEGNKKIEDNEIGFSVDGTEEEVDNILAEDCLEVLSNFNLYLNQAIKLISEELSISKEEVSSLFTPKSLSFFSGKRNKNIFYLWFDNKDDEYALWRVQFNNGKAAYVGRDT